MILILVSLVVLESVMGSERDLTRALLENYVASARPVNNDSKAVEVMFGTTLQMIEKIDEINGSLVSVVWLNLEWSDAHLTWDSYEWGGIEDIRISPKDIWTPDIQLFNAVKKELLHETYAVVTSRGSISYIPPYRFISTCRINTTWFPFDEQSCNLKFGSWVYNGLDLKLKSKDSYYEDQAIKMDISTYVKNSNWHLVSTTGELKEVTYDCCPEPYQDITYTITLRRRTRRYWRRTLIPCIAITMVSIMALLIPATNPTPRFLIIFFLFVLLTLSRPAHLPKLSFLSFLLGWCYFIMFSVLVHSILVTALANNFFLNSYSLVNRFFRWFLITALPCRGKKKTEETEEEVRTEFANICDNFSFFWIFVTFLCGVVSSFYNIPWLMVT